MLSKSGILQDGPRFWFLPCLDQAEPNFLGPLKAAGITPSLLLCHDCALNPA